MLLLVVAIVVVFRFAAVVVVMVVGHVNVVAVVVLGTVVVCDCGVCMEFTVDVIGVVDVVTSFVCWIIDRTGLLLCCWLLVAVDCCPFVVSIRIEPFAWL